MLTKVADLFSRTTGRAVRFLNSRQFLRNVLILTGGTATGQAIIMLSSPILTRLYTPDDFGALTVYSSLFSLLSVIAVLRYELTIPLPKEDETAANLLVAALCIAPVTSLLLAVLIWIASDRIVSWVNIPRLQGYLWLLPLSVLAFGVYQTFSYWAVRQKTYDIIARTKLSQGIGQVSIQIGLGLLKLGPLGLILGSVAGQVGGSSLLAFHAVRQLRPLLGEMSGSSLIRAAGRYRKFPLISGPSVFINAAGLHFPALMLSIFYGPQVVGWFGLGRRVIRTPMQLIGHSVAQVYMGEAARLAQDRPEMLRKLFWQTGRRLLVIGGAPVAAISLGAPWLFRVIFGQEWHESGLYLQILAAMFVAEFVVVPLSNTLNILERQDLQLIWDVGRLGLITGVLWLAGTRQAPAWQAIAWYGGAMLLSYVALFGMCFYTVSTYRPLHIVDEDKVASEKLQP